MKPALAPILALTLLLSGCDLIIQRLGIEDPQQKEAKADAEGRAVGSACRQSGRAIEDCYSVYRWLPKASIFAGWREMNDYMQSNNLGIVEPKLPPPPNPDERKKKSVIGDAKTDNKAGAKTDGGEAAQTDAKAEKKSGDTAETRKDAKSAGKG